MATTTTIEVNGHELEVPAGLAAAGLSGGEINRFAGISPNKITYEITSEGHRIVPANQKLPVQPGTRFGTMDRVIAGGHSTNAPVIDLASVDGVTFEVPPGGALMLPQQMKEIAKAEQKPVLYRVTRNGNEILLPDQPIRVQAGDAFGTLDRVVAGGRNFHRINAELRLLEAAYGPDNVQWTPDLAWVKLRTFRLPQGYNQAQTEMLIHVPETYGLGIPIRECYVNTSLRYYDGNRGRWIKIPHYYDAGDTYEPTHGVKQNGWGYFCLHCSDWDARSNFLTFLNAAFTVLSNPLHPWPTS
jgi:hypothetical protein